MRLRDLRPRTIEGYLLATRLFIERVDNDPEKLTEDDIRTYFLHLRDDKHQASSSINIAICALRFFFNFTLERDCEVFNLLRVHRTRSRPVMLSRGEVHALLSVVRHPARRMLLTTICALGLRIGEGLHLERSHIDGARGMVWIRDGKGGKARRVPLPKPILLRLRRYWKEERPTSFAGTGLPISRGSEEPCYPVMPVRYVILHVAAPKRWADTSPTARIAVRPENRAFESRDRGVRRQDRDLPVSRQQRPTSSKEDTAIRGVPSSIPSICPTARVSSRSVLSTVAFEPTGHAAAPSTDASAKSASRFYPGTSKGKPTTTLSHL